ncbi:MAG: hypothetical protein ACOX52_23480 [Verrucomicrobiota bacterium]
MSGPQRAGYLIWTGIDSDSDPDSDKDRTDRTNLTDRQLLPGGDA